MEETWEVIGDLLHKAAEKADLAEIQRITRVYKSVPVRWRDSGRGLTILHVACVQDNPEIVSFLVTLPTIINNINEQSRHGSTPFSIACANNSIRCAKILLKQPGLKPNEFDGDRLSPLASSVNLNRLEIIRLWIASGHDLGFGVDGNWKTDVLAIIRRERTPTTQLLEIFTRNTEGVRHQMRLEVGWYNETAADLFAQVVFLCEGLVRCSFGTSRNTAHQFFRIAQKLPLELQMVLCYRAVGSMGTCIPGKEREAAFKFLAANRPEPRFPLNPDGSYNVTDPDLRQPQPLLY